MASRLDRLIAIDAYIRRETYPSVEALCRLFEVQPRTVHQDVKELRERFNLDIRFNRHRGGYYNANPEQRLPSITFTSEQTLLTVVAIEMLCHFGGPSFRGVLAPVSEALRQNHDDVAKLDGKVQFNPNLDAQLSARTFAAVLSSCLRREALSVGLKSGHDKRSATIIPQTVLFKNGEWYIVALNGRSQTELRLAEIAAAPESKTI